ARALHRPFGRLRIYAGTDGPTEITASVNGRAAEGTEHIPAPDGFGYFRDRTVLRGVRAHPEIIRSLTEAAPAVLRFTSEGFAPEEAQATITVTNGSGSQIRLLWLEIRLE
ncbi:MAG: hypothetical protein IJV00_05550, partial [Clostridia bacterium]|nr:hypothetical protein [Clostridia bacterium]